MAFNNTNTDILVAGAFAAFTVDLLVYPLDTIKTRIQSPDYRKLYTNSATQTANRALFRGLYQGIGSVILATIPSSGAFFTTYEATKTLLHPLPLPTPFTHALASSLAELVSCLILTPAEVLKQNAQMVSTSSPTLHHTPTATTLAFRKFKHSPRHLWRGYTALAGRNLPFTAMQFPLFEGLRGWVYGYRERKGLRTGTLVEAGAVTAGAAGAAGALAAVVTTPVDVVKTRIMLAAGAEEGGKGVERGRRMGAWVVGREVVRGEGWRGLFRGGALRGAWTAAGSGLYLGVYESGRRYLEDRRVGRGEGRP